MLKVDHKEQLECKACHLELQEVDQISKEETFLVVTALRWVHQVVVPWAQRDKVCANVKDKTKTDEIIQMFIFIMYGADKCNKISTCYRVQ